MMGRNSKCKIDVHSRPVHTASDRQRQSNMITLMSIVSWQHLVTRGTVTIGNRKWGVSSNARQLRIAQLYANGE